MRRFAATIALAALAAALLTACGGSSSEGTGSTGASNTGDGPPGAAAKTCETDAAGIVALQATAVSCAAAQEVLLAWRDQDDCAAAPGASRSACTVSDYRCIGAVTSVGLAVSCARQGHAIAFVEKLG